MALIKSIKFKILKLKYNQNDNNGNGNWDHLPQRWTPPQWWWQL
jgi:hypothetical protein